MSTGPKRRAMQTSPLRLGSIVSLATLAFASVVGLIAVTAANNVATGLGTGVGVAFVVFISGATTAVGLACLSRGRLEWVAVAALAFAGLFLDLFVLALWQEIDDETYARVAGIAATWAFFLLVVLGLALAVDRPGRVTRWVFLAATSATVAAGLISTYLIVFADSGESADGAGVTFFALGGVDLGSGELLRVLGVALVLLATLWFATLATHRLERAPTAET